MDDRYRGISNGRRVILINTDDATELGFSDRELVARESNTPGYKAMAVRLAARAELIQQRQGHKI